MKRTLQCVALSLASTLSAPGLAATWLRDAALSPDGRSIAFRSNGDLYVASVADGKARVLRDSPAHEAHPVWLDDNRIAYAADTHGNYDVFVTTLEPGGAPQRLTWHSRNEVPVGRSPDGKQLLVRTARLDLAAGDTVFHPYVFSSGEDPSVAWGAGGWPGIFSLGLAGGMPQPLLDPGSREASWDGRARRLVFSVWRSTEIPFRKHERSPATADIWLYEPASGRSRALTRFDGHDTNPVWNQADGRIYYLSERSGSMNVWRMGAQGDAAAEAVTRHQRHPVRDLTLSTSGLIAYSYHGQLYAGRAGGDFRRIPIQLPERPAAPATARAAHAAKLDQALGEVLPLPGFQQAIALARGSVYALDRASAGQRALFADQPGIKRSPSLSADGRQLLVVRDSGTASDLLLARLPDSAASWMQGTAHVRVLAEQEGASAVITRAVLSPDGTRAAFIAGNRLKVIEFASGTTRDLLDREQGMVDADMAWHPAGEHLALHWRNRQRMADDVAVLGVADGALYNLSRSGFNESMPVWRADGRALLWRSDLEGLRTFHLGSAGSTDAYALFLDPRARHAHEAAEPAASVASALQVNEWLGQLRDDPSRLTRQRVRLTGTSVSLQALAPAADGLSLLHLQHTEGTGGPQLWSTSLPAREARLLLSLPKAEGPEGFSGGDAVRLSADGREALVLSDGRAYWVALQQASHAPVVLKAVAAEDPAQMQRWMFEHAARMTDQVYYRPEYLPQIRWPEYVADYRQLLPGLTHPVDFAEMMSELLGELNSSHTYFQYRPASEKPVRTGSLGVLYDPHDRGPGWKLAEVLPDSPLLAGEAEVRAGDRIVRVNDTAIPPRTDPARLLADTAQTPISLTIRDPAGRERAVRVKPVGNAGESQMFYERWVQWQRTQTLKLSGGRIGYVHMRSMSEATFRRVVHETLGADVDKEAIVLDTRFNQGGWIHEPLLGFLSAPYAFHLRADGTVYASEPVMRIGRPFAMLVNSANYSNGSENPRLVQEQGLAPLVGEAIAGTGLGNHADPLPYWEYGYGIAYDTCLTPAGEYWENVTTQPDIAVPWDRDALHAGRDVQLEAAVKHLLQQGQRP